MATEVYHLARENRKKVGQGEKKKVSEDKIILRSLKSKCSFYCILILSKNIHKVIAILLVLYPIKFCQYELQNSA